MFHVLGREQQPLKRVTRHATCHQTSTAAPTTAVHLTPISHGGQRASVRHYASPVSHSPDSRKKLRQRHCLLTALQTAPTTLRIMCDDSCTLPVSAAIALAPLTLAQSSAACGYVVISGAKAQCQVDNGGGNLHKKGPNALVAVASIDCVWRLCFVFK